MGNRKRLNEGKLLPDALQCADTDGGIGTSDFCFAVDAAGEYKRGLRHGTTIGEQFYRRLIDEEVNGHLVALDI